MNIVMISPGYPAEMAFFARGLADAGATVIGIGDQPPSSVPHVAREALTHYQQVASLAAGDAVAATVHALARHVPHVIVEEFVDGEEFTYDTICAGGRVLFENICWYRPRPLLTKLHEWISPVTVALRALDAPDLQAGRALGAAAVKALGFRDGFTHMEGYRKASGEAVFGEIGARPPGGRMVDVMNYATDADLFRAWAEAITQGRISRPIERHYN